MRLKLSKKLTFIILFCITVSSFGEETEYKSITQLKANGFVKCSGSQSATTKWLFDKDDFAHLGQWNSKNPDKHIGSTLVSKKFSDATVIAAISTTPTVNDECDSTFVQVMTFSETCPKLRDTVFKDWKFYNDLGGTPVYEDPTSANVSIVLTPVQTSCLVIKHGILFFPSEIKRGK